MSENAQVLKNWDWDKLQEKLSKQRGYGTPPPRDHSDEDEGEEQQRQERRENNGGGNNNNGRHFPQFKMPNLGRGVILGLLAIVVVWLMTGWYIVEADQQGIVLIFGKYNSTTDPGLHYAPPAPIGTVYRPSVTQILRSEVGYRNAGQSKTFQQGRVRSMPQEASMLTGDENVVNVQFSIQYKIKDPVLYLFNVAGPTELVRNAAEAAMREIIGNNLIDAAITDGKLKIQNDATLLLQNVLDRYGAGIQVIAVQLQDVHPPQEVIEAFKDVASAREDKSRIINEAEAYRNALLPAARGQASAIRNEAEGYSATRVQNAEGAATRFDALRVQYEKAPEVTRQRLYYETIESILEAAQEKLLLDGPSAQKALPYLPLPALSKPVSPEVKK